MKALALLNTVIDTIPVPDDSWNERAWARLDSLTKPPRSLGMLEEIAQRLAVLQRTESPSLPRKAIVLMAGDHGVTAQGISPYPMEVTAQMVANIASGGAAINQLAAHADAQVVVVDVGVATPLLSTHGVVQERVANGTADMTFGPAMTREQALSAIGVGIEQVAALAVEGLDLVGTGDMGIGNTTASAAITSVLTGVDPVDVVGPGTGLDEDGVRRKAEIVRLAIEVNTPDPLDPLDVLTKVGGLEIAGIVGVVLGAAALGIPVVSDGYISGAAALVALHMAPALRPWLFVSHRSAEPGHTVVLEALGLRPVLQLEMRLGEGTGAALAMEIMDAACCVMSGMATFDEAGVSERDE
jgi:nicotinate-nucleotide--dimethylbenzimidazole phosphoribosyltransferase